MTLIATDLVQLLPPSVEEEEADEEEEAEADELFSVSDSMGL